MANKKYGYHDWGVFIVVVIAWILFGFILTYPGKPDCFISYMFSVAILLSLVYLVVGGSNGKR